MLYTDIDECRVRGICATGAKCKNIEGDYKCTCIPPLVGDGKTQCGTGRQPFYLPN